MLFVRSRMIVGKARLKRKGIFRSVQVVRDTNDRKGVYIMHLVHTGAGENFVVLITLKNDFF